MQNGRIKALSWFCAGLAMVAAAIVVYRLGGIITLLPAERSYRAPCVVLVINDNPYGLMVALSYMCRTCP
jgi:hypothetical protein